MVQIVRKGLLILVLFCSFATKLSFAQTYTVDLATDNNPGGNGQSSGANSGDLRYVLSQINAVTSGSPATSNTVNITAGPITLAGDLQTILNGVTINGAGNTIDGASLYQIFATFAASLKADDLTVTNGLAQGGDGAGANELLSGAGGGGGGFGGGFYIAPGQTLDISNTTISSCAATGGQGGDFQVGTTATEAGGGGGASFSNAAASSTSQSGGGDYPGALSNGGSTVISGVSNGYGGGAGGDSGLDGGLGGGNGAGTAGTTSTTSGGGNGGYCGGGGGGGGSLNSLSSANGGGGGNGGADGSTDGTGDGSGGGGGYGSGGAGGYTSATPALNGGGGGGGFGGGGGGALFGAGTGGGGGGGFGGGGGGGGDAGGSGGNYGGAGAANGAGGGGAGLGGGIFVGDSSTLRIGDGVTLNGNVANPGLGGGSPAANGIGYAPDIFLFQNAQVIFYGSADSTADYSIDADQNTGATSDAGVQINLADGTKTITFGASNEYNGPTNIISGSLRASTPNIIQNSSSLTLANTANVKFELFSFDQTINTLSGGGSTGGDIDLAAGRLTINQMTAGNFAGAISGAGGLTLSSSSTAALTLSGNTTYTGATFVNGGTLIFSGIASESPVTVGSGGVFKISSASTSTASVINNGTMYLSANFGISAGQSLTNNNSITFTNNVDLNHGDYTSTATDYYNINSATVFGSLETYGNVDINNATINLTSDFTDTFSSDISWTIINGGTLSHTNTTVNLPASLFNSWSSSFSGNALILNYHRGNLTLSANPGVNYDIASLINVMPGSNAGQQQLLNSLFAYTDRAAYNNGLQQLLPSLNASAPNIAVQNAVFNKVETRMTTIRDGTASDYFSGLNAGDITPDTAMWLGGFGSKAVQHVIGDNPGYRSNSYGVILGADKDRYNGGVLGFGLAFSRTMVHQPTSAGNYNVVTAVDGYHALMYGSSPLRRNAFFEWLVNGAFNQYDGNRAININGSVMSTSSAYNGAQAGFRINVGKHCNFRNTSRVSPLLMLQYFVTYQPSYNESYSAAALHVDPLHFQNVLTFGGGVRYSFPVAPCWVVDVSEVRALVTYDVLSSDNTVSSNFLVGSSNFVVGTTPARWALRLGVDINSSLSKRSNLQFSYDYELRSNYYDNSILLKVAYIF